MTLGMKKSLLGIILTVLLIGLVAPVAFWFVADALDRVFGFSPLPGAPVFVILAAASMLAGVFWISWAYSYLHFVGKGLPLEVFGRAMHPTRILVTTGPYAYVRNPMIFGLLLLLLGIALLQRSISGLIILPIITLLVALYLRTFEERALRRRFGRSYREYYRHVPLLIPRFSPYIRAPKRAAAKGGKKRQ